jgi:hypothetical protein
MTDPRHEDAGARIIDRRPYDAARMGSREAAMPDYRTRPLDAGTWPDFAELVNAHNGGWGGCWCNVLRDHEPSDDVWPTEWIPGNL